MDDFSTDQIKSVRNSFSNSEKIHWLTATTDRPGKKLALAEAIKRAKGKYLLFTDADCMPVSDQWISLIVNKYKPGVEIVLGYSPYRENKSFLNKFIRYENWIAAILYFSMANKGMPYMGVGRNLSYKKSLFLSFNPSGNDKIISGDDDLFINAVATKTNTAICLDANSFVYTNPQRSLGDYINQKHRHTSASRSYKFIDQVLLFIFSLSHIIVYASCILLCFTDLAQEVILTFLLLLALKIWIAVPLLKRLRVHLHSMFLPVMDIMLCLYYLILTPFLFTYPKKWK